VASNSQQVTASREKATISAEREDLGFLTVQICGPSDQILRILCIPSNMFWVLLISTKNPPPSRNTRAQHVTGGIPPAPPPIMEIE